MYGQVISLSPDFMCFGFREPAGVSILGAREVVRVDVSLDSDATITGPLPYRRSGASRFSIDAQGAGPLDVVQAVTYPEAFARLLDLSTWGGPGRATPPVEKRQASLYDRFRVMDFDER